MHAAEQTSACGRGHSQRSGGRSAILPLENEGRPFGRFWFLSRNGRRTDENLPRLIKIMDRCDTTPRRLIHPHPHQRRTVASL